MSKVRRKLANLISNVLNPFLVSLVMLSLISFHSATSIAQAIKWSLLSIALSILPIFLIMVCFVHMEKLEGIFTSIRQERNKIYLWASVFALVDCIVLYYLGAPRALVAMFVAGLCATVVFMGINLLWKISLHTAFMAAVITVLTVLYGYPGMVAVVLLPPVAWARVELEHHSVVQVAGGALLATLIVVVVFYLFGLISF
jgi:membrane-associated phospholipid phosphatase